MSSLNPLASITGTFSGASSIALRFAGFEQYQQAVLLYCNSLGRSAPPVPFPTKPTSYSIRISDSLELLCVWQSPALETNCTIVYWGVGTEPAQIEAACAALVANGYTLLEAPGKSPAGSGDKENTQRAVLKDKSGQRIGVVINPPVPFIGAGAPGTMQLEFPVEPTHVINPPVTVDGGNNAGG